MFNKNPYALPQGASLSHHFHTADEILFHHHHHDADILSGHYFAAAANAPAVDAAAAFYNHHHDAAALDPSSMVPKTAKKDRHSKIYTSQGPRDRRVRLSIGVARRFFDLQEILGFDKPSKTLDWLLTNSTTAIKNLIQTKENENVAVSASSPSECEADSALGGVGDRTKQDLVKESRVKARARARERTREKMCIKQFNDDLNSSIPIHHMNEFCRISGTNNNHSDSIFYSHDDDLIQHESIVIKRKAAPLPSPNYNNPTENWDICAILDSHKFINSTSEN